MSITNTSKPVTSVTNNAKVSIGETYATITSSWSSETRTWLKASSLVTNISIGITGFIWSLKRTPWTESAPWLDEGGISNASKPV